MQFARMQLTGFKSFVEPTELAIERGLTGVVGPNGCGKSNLVEALRWVMGETSARRVRGSEMDDVIFAGTDRRPARNVAEVALTLDNADRSAPAQFNDLDEIGVVRRIERGAGSAYRVNGSETRARDVQTLFADASSGARSTALVSQGQIGALVAARPADRRLLLEEASGITGLHARRHEAELRLRAAEANLERLQDVIGSLEDRHRHLRRQARQASRYRSLSDRIRRQEAVLLHLQWTAAQAGRARAAEDLAAVEETVAELARAVAGATTAAAEAAAAIPGFREVEAEKAAALRRLTAARDALDAEERRIEARRGETVARLAQIDSDAERERDHGRDAGRGIARLDAESDGIGAARAREAEEAVRARALLDERGREVAACQREVDGLVRDLAAWETRQGGLERRLSEIAARRGRLSERCREMAAERDEAEKAAASGGELERARAAAAEARGALDGARAALERAAARTAAARAAESDARGVRHEAESGFARLRAERDALAGLLADGGRDRWRPVIDGLEVDAGYEAALGAALGDDLNASTDADAPVRARGLAPAAAAAGLPPGVERLADRVRGPDALDRRLSQIGVVDGDDAGRRLQGRLAQGQRLVSRDGALWRWDGFSISAGTPTAAAVRLAQRNRLGEVGNLLGNAERRAGEAGRTHGAATAALEAAEEDERRSREAVAGADLAFRAANDAVSACAERSADARSRAAALAEAVARADGDLAELDEQEAAAREELAGLGDGDERRRRVGERRGALARLAAEQADARSARDRLEQASETRRLRLEAIVAERRSWEARAANAGEQLERLAERRSGEASELERLEARPAGIAAERSALLDRVEEADRARAAAADRRAEAETLQAETGRRLREREAGLVTAREDRVRREAAVGQQDQILATIAERSLERVGCAPEQAREAAGLGGDAVPPSREDAERRLERLNREREGMGAINLRAEGEAADLDERIRETESERTDLVAAVAKLRRGISDLDREGRERLLAAFEDADRNFREVFARLFGGGRAHLRLTDSDDPLEAGLEVFASPPGKRLRSMSLLSGGEQALTALSLLFAVFLVNPAPVCVLDEVDAPLDDSNVDRFCSLLEEMAERLETRFLLVTHHRLTMARMDRLYGVTMTEPGVSRLVSVDLRTAGRLRDAA